MGFRYIGTKARIFPWILEAIEEVATPGCHVVDLMTGTASVASALRFAGYRVTANDVMTYSRHHANIALLCNEVPQFEGLELTRTAGEKSLARYEKVLAHLGQLPLIKGYFWREFSLAGRPRNGCLPRNYFTPENAQKIDAARVWIKTQRECGGIGALEHSLLLHDLIMAANDVANIAGTYGHFLSKTIDRARIALSFTPTRWAPVPNDAGGHMVIQGYAEEVSKNLEADVCYIDPPYMKRQYAANYHVLETLAREDEPEAVGVSGLRPWRDQYSNFCTKTKITESFRAILEGMRCKRFIVSYSEDGLLPVPDILQILSEFGRTSVREFKYKRFRSNASMLAPELTEYLLIADVSKRKS